MRRSISAAWIVRSLPMRSCSIVCSERMRAASIVCLAAICALSPCCSRCARSVVTSARWRARAISTSRCWLRRAYSPSRSISSESFSASRFLLRIAISVSCSTSLLCFLRCSICLGQPRQALGVEGVARVEELHAGLVELGQRRRLELEAVLGQVLGHRLAHPLDVGAALLVQLFHRHLGRRGAQGVDELAFDQLLQLLRLHRAQAERLRRRRHRLGLAPRRARRTRRSRRPACGPW